MDPKVNITASIGRLRSSKLRPDSALPTKQFFLNVKDLKQNNMKIIIGLLF